MDCETLSPNARKIFDKITKYYSDDPWGNMQWSPDGLVCDNGWCDLRQGEVRNRLIERYEHLLGRIIVLCAKGTKAKGREITESVFDLRLSQKWIELAVLLYELDFQIETLDLVESPNVSYGPRLPEPPFGEIVIPEDLKDKGILSEEQSNRIREALGFEGDL